MNFQFNCRLLISNIRLSIVNLYHYVRGRAVVLQADTQQLQPVPSIQHQLAAILSHIEDLQAGLITSRD